MSKEAKATEAAKAAFEKNLECLADDNAAKPRKNSVQYIIASYWFEVGYQAGRESVTECDLCGYNFPYIKKIEKLQEQNKILQIELEVAHAEIAGDHVLKNYKKLVDCVKYYAMAHPKGNAVEVLKEVGEK